jgi:CheY-like chemotaxis protein
LVVSAAGAENTDARPVVLVAEDEALQIMDLTDVLEEAGFAVEQCASAERATQVLAARPEIVGLVTDVELSGRTNGFELARSAAEARPHMPIVVVSGRAVPDLDSLPQTARFIARPCRSTDILDALRALMPAPA